MGKNSPIEWTHHTFNPWWGCAKVSDACKYCYAEVWAKRTGKSLWGISNERRIFGEQHWNEPIKWNRQAESRRTRQRVFCSSMADVFEERDELDKWREKLWALIEKTPWLDWLLLSKRPQNVRNMVPWSKMWPKNVWLGITVENQENATERIPFLLDCKSTIKFVSCEPLLGPLDLSCWLESPSEQKDRKYEVAKNIGINWVIAGGESGSNARPADPSWIRRLRDQCLAAQVPFYFKQWGNWCPDDSGIWQQYKRMNIKSQHGESIILVRLGKKRAGKTLDGKIWNSIP